MISKYKQALIDLQSETDHEKAHFEADEILKNVAIDAAAGLINVGNVKDLIEIYSKILKYYS